MLKEDLVSTVHKKRVSHSQILFGPKGCEKLALTLAYAQFLNCENREEKDSCNVCSACIKYNKLIHPDLHIVIPVIKSKKDKKPISENVINFWREEVFKDSKIDLFKWSSKLNEINKTNKKLEIYTEEVNELQKKLSLKRFEGKYKVIVFWMPEKTNLQASNKLLKILEEPPEKTIFLMVSENIEELLPTVLSRLQKTRVKNEKNEMLLQSKIDQEDEKQNLELFKEWMRVCYGGNIIKLNDLLDIISKLDRQRQERFLTYSIKMIRQSIVYNFSIKSLISNDGDELIFLTNFAKYINKKNVKKIVDKIEMLVGNIKRNANMKTSFYDASLNLMKLIKQK